MTTARLLIAVEGGADARRAFGQIATEHRRANQAMSTEARRATQERQQLSRAEAQASQRDTRAIEQNLRRFERDRTQTALRAARDRAQGERRAASEAAAAQRHAQSEAAKAARETTRVAEREADKRTRATAAAATAAIREERRVTRAAEIEARARDRTRAQMSRFDAQRQREQTTAARRDAREREQGSFWTGRLGGSTNALAGVGGAMFTGVRAAASFALAGAEGLHDQRQAARQSRAAQVRDLNGALLQTGATAAEMGDARSRLEAFSLRHGIPFADLVAAASQAQTRHSALAGATAADRGTAMGNFLDNARDAYVMHQDVGESTAFGAMLGQNGIRGEQQRQMVGAMTQISFNGAVELGDALRQGLGPMLQYVNAQVARAPAGADRQQTYMHAMREFYAAMQAERAGGNNVGWSGGRLAHLDTALGNQHTQDLLRGRLLATVRDPAQRARIAEMFESDGRGHHALTSRFRNVVNFTERATELYGGNSERFANAMAAGGHGVPQVLQQPDVRAIRALMGTDVNDPNRHVYDAIRGAYGADATLDAQTRRTAEDVTANEDATRLNRDEETHAQALLDNTGAITRFSDRLASYMAAHPLEAQLGGTSGSAAIMAVREHSTEQSRAHAAVGLPIGYLMGPVGLMYGAAHAALQIATGGNDGPALAPGAGGAEGGIAGVLARLHRAVVDGVREGASQATLTVNPADAHVAADTNNRPRPQLGQ